MKIVEDSNFTHYITRPGVKMWAFVIRLPGASDLRLRSLILKGRISLYPLTDLFSAHKLYPKTRFICLCRVVNFVCFVGNLNVSFA